VSRSTGRDIRGRPLIVVVVIHAVHLVTWWQVPLGKRVMVVAREVIERLVDDLDGGEAVETVKFGLDGTSYEIDLSKRNAASLRKTFDRYVRAARRDGVGRSRRRAVKSSSARPPAKASRARAVKSGQRPVKTSRSGAAKAKRGFDLVQLREWAGANDVRVPSRGRIPQAVVEQYKAAGGR
jgi:hypothetical protein